MEKVKELAFSYYTRKDIQSAIYQFSQNREAIPRYGENFGKRPDALQYESDIAEYARRGATSFHVSQEIWFDPLQVKTGMSLEETNHLRKGWDLLIDIDSKYLDYSRITAQLIIRALEFHGIKNYGIKFSGSKGMHILIPQQAFPDIFQEKETKNMFPEWPKMITLYLTELIQPELIEEISMLTEKSYVRDFDAPKKVMPDLVLVSSRHLFRAPYSLHEKTALASITLEKEDLNTFSPQQANPLGIKPKKFYPEPGKNEAKELLLQAMDWWSEQEKNKTLKINSSTPSLEEKKFEEIPIQYITEDTFPPTIQNLLKGMKDDGRKRALFILIAFFRSLNFSQDYITRTLEEWNKKNYKPLKEGYIKTQLSWFQKQKKFLPPNFDSDYYKTLGIFEPDSLSEKMKNPIPYTLAKARMKMQPPSSDNQGKSKSKENSRKGNELDVK